MTFKWRGREVIERVRQAANRGVLIATEAVKDEAISSMRSSPATGRTYQRRGVTHVASSPGNPPRPDTGTLINRTRTEYDRNAMTGKVVFATEYAAALEYGTEKMEPRPYARNSLSRKRKFVEDTIDREISAELRKAR